MQRLLTAARASSTPVIWTQVSYTSPTLADAGFFHLKAPVISVWQKGDTRGLGENMPGLEPIEGEELVLKRHPSAFFGTELAGMLRFMGVDTVVIVGVSTSGCVRATALDAMCHNFRP
jgi:nicotinamidase-related amidase